MGREIARVSTEGTHFSEQGNISGKNEGSSFPGGPKEPQAWEKSRHTQKHRPGAANNKLGPGQTDRPSSFQPGPSLSDEVSDPSLYPSQAQGGLLPFLDRELGNPTLAT